VLSFISMFYGFPVSFVFSIIALTYLIVNLDSLLLALDSRASIWFTLYVFIQILSYMNYVVWDYSRDVAFTFPVIPLNGLSYILIPQILFYFLGFTLAKDSCSKHDQVQKIITIFFGCVYTMGLVLHFSRPDFFNAFLERMFLNEIGTGYVDFYPRMTIYWNSMIVGVLGVCFFWLSVYVKGIKMYWKWILGVVFISSVLFSTQRGAWLALGISTLLFIFMNFSFRRIALFLSGLMVVGIVAQSSPNFFLEDTSAGIFIDLLNRFDNLDVAFSERSYQFENFINVITNFPSGVGLGMLSHKAADLGLLLTTPDGNYYRIFGELGVLGAIAFSTLVISTMFKAFERRDQISLIICSIYAVQALGTNVFDLYAAGFLFWFIFGLVNGGYRSCASRFVKLSDVPSVKSKSGW
jgi:hypothetical protein